MLWYNSKGLHEISQNAMWVKNMDWASISVAIIMLENMKVLGSRYDHIAHSNAQRSFDIVCLRENNAFFY